MNEVSIVGLDLAKRVIQAHGASGDGSVVFRKRLTRDGLLPFLAAQAQCVVAMEACAGAHHWGREISRLGHEVRLIPPAYVRPFVKRQKNDASDAEAICEAAARPTMRFVAVKGEKKQASAIVSKTRDLLVRQRTQAVNTLRGHLAEFGIVAPEGLSHVRRLKDFIGDPTSGLPETGRAICRTIIEAIEFLSEKVRLLTKDVAERARKDDFARRLMTIPGMVPVIATAIEAYSPPASGDGRQPSINLLSCSKTECQTRSETNAG